MSHQNLCVLRLDASVKQNGRIEVPPLVRGGGNTRRFAVILPKIVRPAERQGCFSAVIREDIGVWIAFGEHALYDLQQGDGADSCLCFRQFEQRTVADVVDGALDMDNSLVGVKVSKAQTQQLAAPGAGILARNANNPNG